MVFGKFNKIETARNKRDEAVSQLPETHLFVKDGPVEDKEFFDELFKLQGRREKESPMDYHKYAEDMWQRISEKSIDTSNAFGIFENSLIVRLHDIEMHPLVYDHVRESIASLVEQYKDSVRMISLWSTGDVGATGYQVGKIESSKIVQDFMREVLEQTETAEGKNFLRSKTRYDVADNKFDNLVNYLSQVTNETDGEVKIVVIEDSYGNFKKVKDAIASAMPDRVDEIKVRCIWAMYSREGLKSKEDAAKDSTGKEELEKKLQVVEPIGSFSDLLDQRFADDFKDAHIFIDFDGVIGDNVRMRDAQASATLSAAIDGISIEEQCTREEAKQRIFERFKS